MKFADTWSHPPRDLTLSRDEVHVWCTFLQQSKTQIHRLEQTLSVEEQIRMKRFYFQKDRGHFIVARGVLRDILGRYLHRQPGELNFCYNSYGKPALTPESGGKILSFNVSHSAGIALYAITCGRSVGIDVEQVRPEFARDGIAERFFSAEEIKALRALPEDQKKDAFFNCWTRKEAFIKATGQGVSFGLENFSVSLTPHEPAALLSIKGESQEDPCWSLKKLPVLPGYKAALAVEGHGWQLKKWQWQLSEHTHEDAGTNIEFDK
ncbi:4'-phosphopantetheinyl transferase superfamily protein [candidate division KSB1 bacterium]|nr:4'-phosphopantetheinyl transferase superfamily protein [candidate division KSB1 bacterium]NIR71675.1 4'-phosphopantetheinyl transferase superfamily protein [candidate division KSB1 bacterium]NIS26387.1 4'-phosphopantetheinyl transferase superfamily protein [candidate division KSB1 bacterium]NIT73146.1 4'-phosphopantetheinyl transferase superfamily protein [candidate division KSB1 bacterium]NIU27073.1 4'-phosphopantetheinyl transferase superfamily protein [candidate division KSB1 bacterium]